MCRVVRRCGGDLGRRPDLFADLHQLGLKPKIRPRGHSGDKGARLGGAGQQSLKLLEI